MTSLPDSFEGALRALARWLESEAVPYTVIGGLAVSLLGQPRVTQDIDVTVWLGERSLDSFVRSGEHHGFVPRILDAVGFAARARVVLLRHGESGISVDVSCGALPFEQEMIERAGPVEVGGLRVKVLTPEDLIVMKVVAQRAKDLNDVEALLRTYRDLDLKRIRYWTREFATALETPEIVNSLERILARQSES